VLLSAVNLAFGKKTTDEELATINCCHEGKEYLDKDAAKAKQGTSKKAPLTSSPFVLEFKGMNAEGCWVCKHMVLQLEDCVDCLKVLHRKHDFIFMLDHLCGHDRQREDGLNSENVNKSYGGN
jgi:hypothetical protein